MLSNGYLGLDKAIKIRRSVQQNMPYGSGNLLRSGEKRPFKVGYGVPVSGMGSLLRSGDTMPVMKMGGLHPAALVAAPILAKAATSAARKLPIIGKPIDKFLNFFGFGGGIAGGDFVSDVPYRKGGFWSKVNDWGVYQPQLTRDPRNAQGDNVELGKGEGPFSHLDRIHMKILERKLFPLAQNPLAFADKIEKLRAKGEGYWKRRVKKYKKAKIARLKAAGVKHYFMSKKYKHHKAKYMKKHGKGYRDSEKYKKHKLAYLKHHYSKLGKGLKKYKQSKRYKHKASKFVKKYGSHMQYHKSPHYYKHKYGYITHHHLKKHGSGGEGKKKH
jgi:hypothetical protein